MSARLLPGQMIPGTRYRVLAKVGQGAMGMVYSAEHVDLEKRVAVKLLAGGVASDPKAVERFRQEARAASKIGSPYICDVTDFGVLEDGRVFFVMEFLDGRSLRDLLDGGGALPIGRVIGVLRQVCKALAAAHDKGIIHLDVKPDNVMLLERARRTDAAKVVDFGIAGLVSHADKEKSSQYVSGTPAYMAPERALGRGYDHRSDIYSVGISAYELLTGSLPFDSEDVATTLRRQVGEAPEPMAQRVPDRHIPPAIEAVVMRLLAKLPDERPQSMAEVEALLCEAQIAAGVQTPWDDLELPAVDEDWRTRLAERMPSPRSRRTRALLASAISMTVAALLIAVYFGVFRTKRVLIPVEITRTEEPPGVAEHLSLAHRSAQAQRYVPPPNDSALVHIEQAEDLASKLGFDSPGARTLRQAYASALSSAGTDLLGAGLRDLAITKFKQALLFDPGDPELRRKAELTPGERQELDARARKKPSERQPTAPKVSPEDQAKALAAALFVAARSGRLSEARSSVRPLQQVDGTGVHAARVADALRPLARSAWTENRREDARSLYILLAQLDPGDAEARERAKAPVAAPPAPKAEPVAAAPAPPPSVQKFPRKAEDEPPDMPRDIGAGKAAASVGLQALSHGRLDEAEAAFRRAVHADPLNPVAVGGLAEVAFEHAHYTDALDYGRRATKLAPKSAKFQTILGDAYFKLLRYQEARAAYNRALALAPEDARVKSRLERINAKVTER